MLDRAAFGLLLLWVVSAPVLYGSVPEAEIAWPYSLFLALGFLVLGVVLAPLLASPSIPFARGREARIMLLAMALLLLLAMLQLVPLPTGLFAVLAPGHARDLALLLPERALSETSTDPGLTAQAALRLAVLLAAALAVLRHARTANRAWLVLGGLAAAASFGAAYGMLESSVFGDRVLGLEKERIEGGVTGTFFYRGNFAAFTAAALGITAVGLVTAFRRRRPALAAAAAMALVLLVSGLVLSRSRAGLVAGGLALAVGFALPLRSGRGRVAVAGLAIAGVIAAGLFSGELRERFAYIGGGGSHGFLDIRVPAWGSTLDLAAGRPVGGCGLGAFRTGIHLTQSPLNPNELYYAHSDPLNLLAEGGVLGLLLGVVAAAMGLLAAFRLAREPGRPEAAVGVASAAGLAGVLSMALVDFPLQIPGLALAFVAVAFLSPAVGPREGRPEPPPPVGRRVGTASALVAAAATAALLLSVAGRQRFASVNPGALTRGAAVANRGRILLDEGRPEEAAESLALARELQPFDGPTRYALSRSLYRLGRFEESEAELRAARRLAHGRAKLLFRIGEMAYRAGWSFAADALREAGATEPRFFPIALHDLVDDSLVPAIVPERGFAYRILGDWHLKRDRPEEALEALWRAFELGERVEGRLATVYRGLGRVEDGRRLFAERGAVWPD